MSREALFVPKLLLMSLVVALTNCATPVPRDAKYAHIDHSALTPPDLILNIPGLSPCTTNSDTTIHLYSADSVQIIVHGCYGSAGRFRALSQVYAFHGQQSICFSYNDRDSLYKSADELAMALRALAEQMENRTFNVIAHSQGGLIARRALTNEQSEELAGHDLDLHLTTISSPFAGIAAANHCASRTARVISLGLTVPICWIVSGGKWFDITMRSPFIKQPGTLLPQISEHYKIVTDEEGSCRRFSDNQVCVEDDFVFTTEEQYSPVVDDWPSVENIKVRAGHAEIVGDYQMVPYKLIELLQQQGLMHHTEPSRHQQLNALLSRLYLDTEGY